MRSSNPAKSLKSAYAYFTFELVNFGEMITVIFAVDWKEWNSMLYMKPCAWF